LFPPTRIINRAFIAYFCHRPRRSSVLPKSGIGVSPVLL
jgi:hypothetical protein